MGERYAMPLIKFLGVEGKKVDIIPRTDEGIKGISCLTELWNKKGEYLGYLAYDKRVRWKRFVLIELDKDMQMSQDCLNEAFELTKEYWKNETGGQT